MMTNGRLSSDGHEVNGAHPQGIEALLEARRHIHNADACILGRRSGHVSQEVISEVMAHNREASVLITQYLHERGVD